MGFDIFISYRRSSTWQIGELLYNSLKANGWNPFFDGEEMVHGEDFVEQLKDAISSCHDFILLLKDDDLIKCDNEDDWVRKEIHLAYSMNKHIIPVFVDGDINLNVKDEIAIEVSKRDAIYIDRRIFKNALQMLTDSLIALPKVVNRNSDDTHIVDDEVYLKTVDRIANKYDTTRFKTQERLSVQQTIILPFNNAIYERYFKDKTDFDVLDLGSNNGNSIMNSVLPSYKPRHIIGVERSEKMIEQAQKYVGTTPYVPYMLDVESEDFIDNVKEIMANEGIQGFDLIVCTFLLLHLKKPGQLVKKIRKLLKPGGILFIRDVDDLQTVSHPDPDKLVKTFKEIDSKLAHTGFRKMGRELYAHLKDAEYSTIEFIPEEISTVGRDYDERLDLLNMNFSYIKENVMDMIVPNKPSKFDGYLSYVESHYDDLEELFSKSNYYYKCGIVAVIAKR